MNMVERYLFILTLLSILALNAVKTDDTIEALKKILKELNAPNKDRNDEVNPKILYHSRHKHGNSKHGGELLNSPNLMNIQTMNLFLKPNKRIIKSDLTRTGPEHECKFGRCGCNGARCGVTREDDLADEVDRVVNGINQKLDLNEDEWRNDGDRVDANKGLHSDKDDVIKDRDGEYFDKIKNDVRDDDGDEDNIKEKRDDDDNDNALETNSHITLGTKDILNKNELVNNKRIKVNDNLDVIILDKSDLEKLLKNEDFVDLTSKDVYKNYQNDGDDVFQKFGEFIAEEDKTGRTAEFTSLGDFFSLYETMKEETIAKVMGYLKSNKNLNSLNLKHIPQFQRKKLQQFKMRYKRGEIKEGAVREKIVRILFGVESKAKVIAHNQNNNYIFVPKWIYDMVVPSSLYNNLRVRSQKRILPLTFQQMERIYNKEKVKTIPKLVWRKNSEKDIQRFGIPFELEVHGLGQVAP